MSTLMVGLSYVVCVLIVLVVGGLLLTVYKPRFPDLP